MERTGFLHSDGKLTRSDKCDNAMTDNMEIVIGVTRFGL